MGGAIAYDVYNTNPTFWSGIVFVAPMCKISILPPQWVIEFFRRIVGSSGTESFLSTLPLSPSTGDIGEIGCKLASKRDFLRLTPVTYLSKPRLGTSRELIVRF